MFQMCSTKLEVNDIPLVVQNFYPIISGSKFQSNLRCQWRFVPGLILKSVPEALDKAIDTFKKLALTVKAHIKPKAAAKKAVRKPKA